MNRRTFLAAVAVAPLAPVPNPVRPLTLGTSTLAAAEGAFFRAYQREYELAMAALAQHCSRTLWNGEPVKISTVPTTAL